VTIREPSPLHLRDATRPYDAGPPELPSVVDDQSPRPDLARPALDDMREACELPDDLLGGTRAMRKSAEKWLPREAKESIRNHEIRVSRSTCFPFYRDTLCDLAARPFGQDLLWDQEPAEQFSEFLQDVDGSGKSLTVFARDLMLYGIHRGMDFVLVDAGDESGESAATTDSRRVYAQRLDALSVLDVRDETDAAGRKRVTYCRFVAQKVVESDNFQHETETVIVELEKSIGPEDGTRTEWRFDDKTKRWFSDNGSAYNPGKNGIPLFPFYTEQLGPYHAQPVLEDLAWVNLAHFQSRSDHAHVMRIARLITLVTKGFKTAASAGFKKGDKVQSEIVLGPLERINTENTDADAAFLEPNGKSIELSFRDMEQLADECKRLGARHLTSTTGNVTARAITVDDKKSANNLQTFCVRLEVVLRQIMEAVAEWLNSGELPESVQPRIDKEFLDDVTPEVGARALQSLEGYLSKRQRLKEAKRQKILASDFDIDENLAELKEEQDEIDARMAEMAGTPGGVDPQEPEPEDE